MARKFGILCVVAGLVSSLALAAPALASFEPLSRVEIGQTAPDFTAMGADGKPHHLSDYPDKLVVLEWTSPACQFTAKKYKSGAMQALQKQAAAQGAVWLSVNTSYKGKPGYLTASQAKGRVARLHAKVTAFLFDPEGKLGRLYGAKTTPSFFIVGKDGKLAYQGAIDDDWGGDGVKGRFFVKAALEDLAAGRAVRQAETRPYGCAVEY